MSQINEWLKTNKIRVLIGIGLFLFELVVCVWPVGLGYHYKKLLVLISALTCLGIVIRIPERFKAWVLVLSAIAAPGLVIYWLERMTEQLTDISPKAIFYNMVIAYLIELVVWLLTLSVRGAVIGTTTFLTIIYTVNYFVYIFRGRAFSVNDLTAWRTAAKVVENYDFTPNNIMVVAWCMGILWVVYAIGCGRKTTGTLKASRKIALRVGCALIGLGFFWGGGKVLIGEDFWERRGIVIENGFSGLFYSDGFLVSSCIELSRSSIRKPEGYSVEATEQILAQYARENKTEELPHIIMIMNESFADLRVWGDLELNQECLPFYNSLQKDTVRGQLHASVLGGGTANSEFEVLTGCSMGLLPASYYPYQQLISQGLPSMVSLLKQEGYTAYSIHPENRKNWNREKVYEYLGFDYSYWMEDFPDGEVLHAGISDREIYNRVIDIYESREEASKLFLYNVTMQNHGGYTWVNLDETIQATNLNSRDLNMYLNLIKRSDDAFRELVAYFEKQDEKVMICMFGDHQPLFNVEDTYNVICDITPGLTEADKLLNRYKTPFVIWANYDIAEADDWDISMNYLGALLLEQAGINSYPFFNYLEEQMVKWPVITINGAYDESGKYYPPGTAGSAFEEYELLQYHQLFYPGYGEKRKK
ncbi:MAG: LTA synthase family protein [Lachnospiraceae bacterium]|nr:LTA synthase family protein [Lachnospiraceae bacterium]